MHETVHRGQLEVVQEMRRTHDGRIQVFISFTFHRLCSRSNRLLARPQAHKHTSASPCPMAVLASSTTLHPSSTTPRPPSPTQPQCRALPTCQTPTSTTSTDPPHHQINRSTIRPCPPSPNRHLAVRSRCLARRRWPGCLAAQRKRRAPRGCAQRIALHCPLPQRPPTAQRGSLPSLTSPRTAVDSSPTTPGHGSGKRTRQPGCAGGGGGALYLV